MLWCVFNISFNSKITTQGCKTRLRIFCSQPVISNNVFDKFSRSAVLSHLPVLCFNSLRSSCMSLFFNKKLEKPQRKTSSKHGCVYTRVFFALGNFSLGGGEVSGLLGGEFFLREFVSRTKIYLQKRKIWKTRLHSLFRNHSNQNKCRLSNTLTNENRSRVTLSNDCWQYRSDWNVFLLWVFCLSFLFSVSSSVSSVPAGTNIKFKYSQTQQSLICVHHSHLVLESLGLWARVNLQGER